MIVDILIKFSNLCTSHITASSVDELWTVMHAVISFRMVKVSSPSRCHAIKTCMSVSFVHFELFKWSFTVDFPEVGWSFWRILTHVGHVTDALMVTTGDQIPVNQVLDGHVVQILAKNKIFKI